MLVPVQGGVAQLQKRNRTILEQEAALSTVVIPSVYIFNVGPRVWRGVGGGKQWVIPACPKGERFSEPIAIPALVLSERDLADGGNNLDTVIDAALSGTRKVGNESKHVMGVADDVIGKNSTSPGLDLHTTNGEWFGVFVSQNELPTDDEIDIAESKLRDMMQLVYAQGAEKVQAGEKVGMADRRLYNEAAEYLRAKPLWGNLDHTMDSCPLCGEDIRKGASICKHCHNRIDADSVEAFFRKQQGETALAATAETPEWSDPGSDSGEGAENENEAAKPAARKKSRGRNN
jgi:hypothetical protein